MQRMNLGGYQPPQSYQDLYKDPEFFAHAYRKYVDELGQDTSGQVPQSSSGGQSSQQPVVLTKGPSY